MENGKEKRENGKWYSYDEGDPSAPGDAASQMKRGTTVFFYLI